MSYLIEATHIPIAVSVPKLYMQINSERKYNAKHSFYQMILFIIRIKKLLLFITFCFAAAISVAQQIKSVSAPDSYRAIHLDHRKMVCLRYMLHAMIKDSKGFLWIGSSSPEENSAASMERHLRNIFLIRRKAVP